MTSATWASERAVVLLSGGQDSTTSLYWARANFARLETISFDYGQRHNAELQAALIVAGMADVASHEVVPVASLSHLGGSGLTDRGLSVRDAGPDGLPSSFVPGRNLLFLTLAAAYAFQRGIKHLVTGVCQTDYSGYPDCRDDTVKAMQVALNLGTGRPFVIHTPLMWLSKAESIHLAADLHGCLAALAWSHTCYEGVFPPCGTCPACEIRARGFREAGLPDPLIERAKEMGLAPA